MRLFTLLFITIIINACSSINKVEKDNYLWLEEVEGDKALAWVEKQNKVTEAKLTGHPQFKGFEKSALSIYEDKDKIPHISIRGKYVYNLR